MRDEARSERLVAEARIKQADVNIERAQAGLETLTEQQRTCVLKKLEQIDSLLSKKITAISNSSGEGKENFLTELNTLRTKNAALKTETLSALDEVSKNKLPALVQEVNLLNKKIGKI